MTTKCLCLSQVNSDKMDGWRRLYIFMFWKLQPYLCTWWMDGLMNGKSTQLSSQQRYTYLSYRKSNRISKHFIPFNPNEMYLDDPTHSISFNSNIQSEIPNLILLIYYFMTHWIPRSSLRKKSTSFWAECIRNISSASQFISKFTQASKYCTAFTTRSIKLRKLRQSIISIQILYVCIAHKP